MSSKNATVLEKCDVTRCLSRDLALMLGVTIRTILDWHAEGCPSFMVRKGRGQEMRFSAPAVFAWHRAHMKDKYTNKSSDLKHEEETQRLKHQNALLEVKIKKARDESIDRRIVEMVAKEQAIALRTFWTDAWKRNIDGLLTAMGSAPENAGQVMDVMSEFVKDALEAFIEGSRPIIANAESDIGDTGEPIKAE